MKESYLTKKMSIAALVKMQMFHDDIKALYKANDMDILDNLGRRNTVMSAAQEKFFASELKKKYATVIDDGKTGQPDIVIEEIGKELECKLTSQHASGAWLLQTDYVTLQKKGSLDYLYVLASADFGSFCVLHFDGLTTDDFFMPGKSGRGRAKLNIHNAITKCRVLHGDVYNKNDESIKTLEERLPTIRPTQKAKRKATLSRISRLRQARPIYKFKLCKVQNI
jgi:hypothetical protein